MDVSPVVEGGRYPAKATVGEPFSVSATIFREGHDELGADVVVVGPDGKRRPPVRMTKDATEPDIWHAVFTPDAVGPWTFEIESWCDPVATWHHNAEIKIPAGIDVDLMFTEGGLLLERLAAALPKRSPGRKTVADALKALRDTGRPEPVRYAAAVSPEIDALLAEHPLRDLVTTEGPYPLFADRARALFGSWYEFFPRSEGAYVDPKTGTVVSRHPLAPRRSGSTRWPTMGFDIIYLPPIHPIGEAEPQGPQQHPRPRRPTTPARRGRSARPRAATTRSTPTSGRSTTSTPSSPGRGELGLEVALDLALQAAPDHPWVTTHPEWFTTRADGTIAYAENPPKKYQDIYPINFDNDPEGIYAEVLRIVRLWMSHGVRIFRVDNPHTKPVAFWEWLLGEVRRTDPDVLFLAEAFTRPAMMRALGAVGFHQSYTYFTWRNAKWEIEEYLREVAHRDRPPDAAELLRQHPRHPAAFLQYGGPAAFKIRAALAATGSPSWGVYAGFELFEHVAVQPGSEEYLDSEKYQIRVRDWDAAEPRAAPWRRTSPGSTRSGARTRRCSSCATCTIHSQRRRERAGRSPSKRPNGGDDTVIVVVNLDPHATRETWSTSTCPPSAWPGTTRSSCTTRSPARTGHWGQHNYVRLDPGYEPAHILTVRRPPYERASRQPDRRARSPPDALRRPTDAGRSTDEQHRRRPVPRHRREPTPRLVQDGGVLRGAGAVVPGLQRRRHRRLQGPDREARLPAVAGRRLPVGAAVLHLAAARRRLRRRRLHQHPPRVRHGRGLPPLPRRGATSAASG